MAVCCREEQNPALNIKINVYTLEQVAKDLSFGCMITKDGKCEMEINRRNTFNNSNKTNIKTFTIEAESHHMLSLLHTLI